MPSLLRNQAGSQKQTMCIEWKEIWRGNKLFVIFQQIDLSTPFVISNMGSEKKHKFPTVPNGRTVMIGKKERTEKERETKLSAGRSSCVTSYSVREFSRLYCMTYLFFLLQMHNSCTHLVIYS